MALIKCEECGKEFSDKANACIHCGFPITEKKICKECGNVIKKDEKKCSKCGYPIKKKKVNKKTIIICSCIIGVILVGIIGSIILGNNNKLVCTFQTTNNVGTLDYKITYTFSNDGSIKTLQGHQYTLPNDKEVAEALWTITNNQQDQYNYYDGLSYKATFSENKEITLDYSIDAKKAPTMFNTVATISGVKGITSNSTKEEIRNIFETQNYTCK